jgi:hypothetical protein
MFIELLQSFVLSHKFLQNAEEGKKDEIEFCCFYNFGRFSGLRYAEIGSSGYISTKQAR